MSTPKYPVLAVFVIGFGLVAGSHLFEQGLDSDESVQNVDQDFTPDVTDVADRSQPMGTQEQVLESDASPEPAESIVILADNKPSVQLQPSVITLDDKDPQVFVPTPIDDSLEDATTAVDASQQMGLQEQVVEPIASIEPADPTVILADNKPKAQLQPSIIKLDDKFPQDFVQTPIEDSVEDASIVVDASQQMGLQEQVVEPIASIGPVDSIVVFADNVPSAQLQPSIIKLDDKFPQDFVKTREEDSVEDATTVVDASQQMGLQEQAVELIASIEPADPIVVRADNKLSTQLQPSVIKLEDKFPQYFAETIAEDSAEDGTAVVDGSQQIGLQEQVVESIDPIETADPIVVLADNMPSVQLPLVLKELEQDFPQDVRQIATQDSTAVSDDNQQAEPLEQVVVTKSTRELVEPDSVPTDYTLSAQSQPASLEIEDDSLQVEQVRQRLSEQQPGIVFSDISESVVTGFFEVVADGQIFYVDESAQYLFDGSLIRLSDQANLTDSRLGGIHLGLIDEVDEKNMLIYEPEIPSNRSITVFTDISCVYCRRLHAEISTLLDAGVRVRYLLFPRAGMGSQGHKDLESVWCAENPQEAMTIAKAGGTIEPMSCDNPIEEHVALAEKLGLQGTPLIYTDSGEKIAGYREAWALVTMVNYSEPLVPN